MKSEYQITDPDEKFEEWWTINKFLLMHDESVGLREIARAGYEAGKHAAQQMLTPELGWTCAKCKTHNADGVSLCGFCDTPRLSG